jgi:4-hydroxythreonine-4-phosphate dehydrogenase
VVVAGDVPILQCAMYIIVFGAGAGGLMLAQVDTLADLPVVPPGCMAVVQACTLDGSVQLGQVDPRAGRAAADCIQFAALAALRREARAVVTAPIHKESLARAGVLYPGHTELLQALAAEHAGLSVDAMPVRMMLSSAGLRTVLVSIHISLRLAIEAVTTAQVLQTIEITHAHFQRLGMANARIAVAGLNPHAGESGLFGREEIDVIAPAVLMARSAGIDASGPHAPDTVFMRALQGEFDVVVAMYHDQGLIPVKLLGLDHGVNTTLGLPFVRTSPDHGTAFDLAGTGRASAASLLAALDAAMGATAS